MKAGGDPRRALLAKAHLAAKDLGLDEEARRAVQVGVTGRESCGAMSVAELELLLAHYRARGWRPKGKAPAPLPTGNPRSRKIRALWGELGRAGAVRAEGREAALRAFCRRMTQVDAPEWLTPEQAGVVIEALKAWLGRAKR